MIHITRGTALGVVPVLNAGGRLGKGQSLWGGGWRLPDGAIQQRMQGHSYRGGRLCPPSRNLGGDRI